MAITINFKDANKDGKGIDFKAYMKAFEKTYEASNYGGFTNEDVTGMPVPNGGYVVHGDDYVTWDGKKKGQSVIFEGGDKGWAYKFDGDDGEYGTADDHTLSGDIKAITFGMGTKNTPDYKNNGEIRIAFNEFDVPDYSETFLSGISDGNTKGLMKFLNSDSIIFNGSTGKDVFTSFKKDDVLHGKGGADTLDGGKGNDSVYGDEGNDKVYGGEGNDTVYGGKGKDRVDGGVGNDTVYGDEGNDKVFGGNGIDTLYGGKGNDKLDGGKGNDTLYGDAGNDTLTGGKGGDIFVFQAGAGKDKITDFGTGADKLNFDGYFADFDSVMAAAKENNKGVTITHDGGKVLLVGWELADLTESHFQFDL